MSSLGFVTGLPVVHSRGVYVLKSSGRPRHARAFVSIRAALAEGDASPKVAKRHVEITNVYETKGGWIVDADVQNFSKSSK